MALVSPGVEVQVIDESFYVPAEPGTRPLLFVVSQENKSNSSGTGIAVGTLQANAGIPYLITSQRELANTFGNPLFYKDASQNPIHGGELNEYGLQAAYSFLGVSNSAYVVRADLDMSQLIPVDVAPSSTPPDGKYWLDTQISRFGVFEWNGDAPTVNGGQKFTNKIPFVITDVTTLDELTGSPLGSIGAIGSYAVVAVTTLNKLYYKNNMGLWVEVGSSDWYMSWPVTRGGKSNPTITMDTGGDTADSSLIINGIEVRSSGTTLDSLAGDINDANIRGVTADVVNSRIEIYSDGATDSSQDDSSLSNAIVLAHGAGNLVATTVAASASGLVVGTYYSPALSISPHTQIPRWKQRDLSPLGRPTGSIWVKTTDVGLGARWRVKEWSAAISDWINVNAPLYSNNATAIFGLDVSGGGKNIAAGTLYVQYNLGEFDASDPDMLKQADFKIFRRERPDPTTVMSVPLAHDTFTQGRVYNFTLAETIPAQSHIDPDKMIEITADGALSDIEMIASAINAAGFKHIVASIDARHRIIISHELGGDMHFGMGDQDPEHPLLLDLMGFVAFNVDTNSGTVNLYAAAPGDEGHAYIGTNWKPLKYTASPTAPNDIPANGRLWFNSILDQVDIMIHNGTKWVGYLDPTAPYYESDVEFQTDPAGPLVSATKPTVQSDGTTLRNGDLWINSGNYESYPDLYKWDGYNLKWVSIDVTDQISDEGVIFADARYNTDGENSGSPGDITDLLYSNFIDFDAPDPALYPRGMLLFNTRRSGNNVKRYVRNYIDLNADNIRMQGESMDTYYPDRWVNESGNAEDGSGLFGRKAQRKVVVQRLAGLINSNQLIRDVDSRTFNLIAAPGYCEVIQEMVAFNIDRHQTAFIIGDTPFRLTPDATTLSDWGNNTAIAANNGENALVTYDDYLGVYYPSGYTTDNFGNNIVVPASHMVLRTIALSDGVSYPWFAPAGLRRGVVNNASSVGYVSVADGEFKPIALNEGQRDTLYSVNINPITYLTGSGIVVFGQKTRAPVASALDRVNVVRLICYLRSQFKKLATPYLFEPNDKITRDEIKASAESMLLELVSQRALYDYLVVCDTSNNTPSRIDRNELYVDIAIEPVKAVEFIYIPIRILNTGGIGALAGR